MSDQRQEVIYSLGDKNVGQLSFNWLGNILVIFDEDNLNVVDSIPVERQKRNIKKDYPKAIIVEEAFTITWALFIRQPCIHALRQTFSL